MNFKMTKRKIIFFFAFFVIVLAGMKINFSGVIGAENQFFTLYQFFGPIAGGFLGPIFGGLAVLFAQVTDFLVSGKAVEPINLLRLTPMLFAAWFFSRKYRKASLIVPILAIAAFILHPVGRQVWFFSLFWTIPILVTLFPKKFLFLRSLGATFTAHSVGGAIWIWTVPMTPEVYIFLIPIVLMERVLFAIGISGSYVLMNTLLHKLEAIVPSNFVKIDKRYILSKKMFAFRQIY